MKWILIAMVLMVGGAAARGAEAPSPAAHDADPALAGRVLLGSLNCTACHAASDAQGKWISPKSAPKLNEIGNRASAEWLMRYLASPQEALPGATMPDLLGDLAPAERESAAEALTHYLLSRSAPKVKRVMPDKAAVARGEGLYHRVGCVACHTPLNANEKMAGSAPLPQMSEKWGFEGLRRFLKDPLATRPSGRMPSLNLTDGEAADIAQYLLRETKVASPLEVAHHRGRLKSLEDIESAELLRTGPAEGFSLDALGRDRGFALRFSGWLRADQAGEYTFYLTAIGASRLSVNGKWLLGEESWKREKAEGSRKVHLEAGFQAIAVDLVQRGVKEPALKVEWEGPGVAREIIPAARLRSEREPVPERATFVLDSAKAAKGQTLYGQLNCAVCHEVKAMTNAPVPISAMTAEHGCLSENPAAKVPHFHLSAAQRGSIQAALAMLNRADLSAPSAKLRVAQTMAALNCLACHARDGQGGVAAERDAYFTSTGEDLGDEGRLPPKLDGVGDRLRPEWLAKVLTQQASVRSYMSTRMPQFGSQNVGHLAELFVGLDRQQRALKPPVDTAEAQREAGRMLVGTDGLSCIACHRFNRQPAQSLQLIDLTTVSERLNEDWFRLFLRDPNKFHPGTRMPAFWPEGKSLMPALLAGDTDRQHAAIWTYLADGTRAKFPEGLSRLSLELVVGGEAVVYRGKLWEAGFRAVAMGYPGEVNAAFDAEEMRLALLWRGKFLNAGAHWGSQGMGQIRPLGTDVAVFPHGAPLAVLADVNAPWPVESSKALGMKFGGYQLDQLKRPTLLYSFKDTAIEDFVTPVEAGGKTVIRRTISFKSPAPDGLYFRVAAGKIAAKGESAWRLDDAMTLTVKSLQKPILRARGDQQELLILIPSAEKNHQLEVDYAW